MSKWKANFEIEFIGEDVFYLSENTIRLHLYELYIMDDIEITKVRQIGNTIKDNPIICSYCETPNQEVNAHVYPKGSVQASNVQVQICYKCKREIKELN